MSLPKVAMLGLITGPMPPRGMCHSRIVSVHDRDCNCVLPLDGWPSHFHMQCIRCGREYCEGQLMSPCRGQEPLVEGVPSA